jgi:DNA-binding MarR family transcriptional regulator
VRAKSSNNTFQDPRLDAWRRQRPDLDTVLLQIRAMLLVLGGHLLRDNDAIARKYGIVGAEMRILFALRRVGKPFSLRPTELTKALLIPSATMTRQIDQLSAASLVQRISDSADRRSQLVLLTDKGMRIADSALTEAVYESSVSSAILKLPKNDRKLLWKALRNVVAGIDGALDSKVIR